MTLAASTTASPRPISDDAADREPARAEPLPFATRKDRRCTTTSGSTCTTTTRRSSGGGRHQISVSCRGPSTACSASSPSSLSFAPAPTERDGLHRLLRQQRHLDRLSRRARRTLDVRMSARVAVSRPEPGLDVSPDLAGLRKQIGERSVAGADTPHHFLAASDLRRHRAVDHRLCPGEPCDRRQRHRPSPMDFCNRIHDDFTYDGKATTVAHQGR